MSVQEIERAIAPLPQNELAGLMIGLENHHEKWDKQIENDLNLGHLDSLINHAEPRPNMKRAKPVAYGNYLDTRDFDR